MSTLNDKIKLVEDDKVGLGAEQQDPEMLDAAEKWIAMKGYTLTVVLIIIWPLLSIPAGVFTKDYFAFWVLLSIAWGFGSAIIIAILPLVESEGEIMTVIKNMISCSKADAEVEEEPAKEVDT